MTQETQFVKPTIRFERHKRRSNWMILTRAPLQKMGFDVHTHLELDHDSRYFYFATGGTTRLKRLTGGTTLYAAFSPPEDPADPDLYNDWDLLLQACDSSPAIELDPELGMIRVARDRLIDWPSRQLGEISPLGRF